MQSSLYGNPRAAKASTTTSNRYGHMEEEIYRENESMLEALGSSVAHMKTMAGQLNREVEEQNELLKSLNTAFQSTRVGVHSAAMSVKNVMSRYGWKYTALFGFIGFLLLYCISAIFRRHA
ncbi:hypothetical protein JKF63_04504 [Porcisia hertigi]|uniref:t-SNARE coiled-coil homology domain-containing protein n=1 Tax=Porcisia hertigi TaxID=2761500 RepID=A0A836HMW4_9TRYP|nr:hypothetical protein JKF63_04504 [Porcisia hertigi]